MKIGRDIGNVLSVEVRTPRLPKIAYVMLFGEIILQYVLACERAILSHPGYFNYVYTADELNAMFQTKMTIGLCFSFIAGALTDGYTGRFCLFYAFYILGCFRPIMTFLIAVGALNFSQREILLNSLGYFYMAGNFVESIRVAMIFEQVKLPKMIANVRRFACLFAISQNTGILISSISCGNVQANNSGTFNLHSVILLFLYVLYVMIFMVMKQKLRVYPVVPHVAEKVFLCIVFGLFRSLKARFMKTNQRGEHWLDRTEIDFDRHFIYNAKMLIELIKFYVPMLSAFTAINFIFMLIEEQSRQMIRSPELFYLKITVFQFFFGILIILIFELVIVRILRKYRISMTPLKFMGGAHCFLAVALVICLGVQMHLEKNSTYVPDRGYGQIRFYNAHVNVVAFQSRLLSHKTDSWTFVAPGSVYVIAQANVKGKRSETVRLKYTTVEREMEYNERVDIVENESISYIVMERGIVQVKDFDPIVRGPPGMNNPERPRVYVLCGIPFCFGEMFLKNKLTVIQQTLPVSHDRHKVFTVGAENYNITIRQGELSLSLVRNAQFLVGGVYCILIFPVKNVFGGTVFTVAKPAIHSQTILLAQLLLFVVGYCLFHFSSLHFVYIQSPPKLLGTTFSILFTNYGLSQALIIWDRTHWHSQVSSYMIITYMAGQAVMTVVHVYVASKFKGQTWTSDGVVFETYEPNVTTVPKQTRRAFSSRSTVGSKSGVIPATDDSNVNK